MKKIFTIEQFGAKADGVFDNTKAFDDAFAAIKECHCAVELYLQPHATYYFANIGLNDVDSAIRFNEIKDLKIIGDHTIILCDGARPYMDIRRCENLEFRGLIFDQKIRSHFVGSFVESDPENLTAIVKADREVIMDDRYDMSNREGICFGLHNTGEVLSRIFYFIESYEWEDKEQNLIRVNFTKRDHLGTHNNLKNRLYKGQSLILPTPEIGHKGERMFTFFDNKDFSFIDCKLWNYPYFGFGIWRSSGTVLFKNFIVEPPIEEPVNFVGWRDTFHCKTNTCKFIWDSCKVTGCNDDIINLSSNMLYVKEVLAPNEVLCYWRETRGGAYGPARFNMDGCPVSIYNIKTGEMVLETKIKKVIDYKTNHYLLEDEIDPTQIGEEVRFVVENHVALGSEIVNCDFKGTLRIKSSHTVRDSKLWLLRMWIEWEQSVEGPIPKNVLFENCDFYVTSPTEKVYIISAKNPVYKFKTDKSYHLGDIVFKGCRGLRKENFLHEESNFTKNSVEEVTIID